MEAYWTFDEKRTFILDKLKNKLTTKRFEHTLRVEKAARYLSKLHHGEHEKVVLAALLHDNAKNYPTDKKLKLCKKYSIALSHAEQQNIDLVHAKLGGVLAREKYGITDPDIINAVMYHTTGRPRMSLTEKIIYIADFIEPGRKEFPGLQKVRKMAESNLDTTLIKILMMTINHIIDRNGVVDTITEDTYEYYYRIYNRTHHW